MLTEVERLITSPVAGGEASSGKVAVFQNQQHAQVDVRVKISAYAA